MIRLFASHATAGNLLMLLLLALGVAAVPNLMRETFPEIPSRDVQIQVAYPGASAKDVENAVCRRIEDAVDGVNDLAEIRCDARENRAIAVAEMAEGQGAKSVVISAKIEEEVSQLDSDEEKQEFLETLGLEETGLARVIRAGYELLGLITFFTVGPKEARAWTVRDGAKAPEAAGVIHTDFEKGFIKAETIAYADYVELGGEQPCKDAGKMRQEGKDYLVHDGDIFLFRFNV